MQLNEIELGKGVDPTNIFVEDINLNGQKDIIYNQPGESGPADLSVLTYDGQNMKSSPRQFKSVSNTDEKIMWMGDFDGDGLTEGIVKKNVLGKSSGLPKPEITISSINSVTGDRKVGVYLSLSYYIGGEIVDGWNIRDFGKTPILGWGNEQVKGIYSSQDINTLGLQIRAMKKSGIDFIIADISNGWADIYKPWPVLGKGAGIPKNAS